LEIRAVHRGAWRDEECDLACVVRVGLQTRACRGMTFGHAGTRCIGRFRQRQVCDKSKKTPRRLIVRIRNRRRN
jgi:hypothetical protein